jgi:hypothetical protein
MDGQNFDPSFGKLPDPFKVELKAPELKLPEPKFETPRFNVNDFQDDEINKATEEGSVQWASGVVRVSDASTYDTPPSNKSIYGETLGVTRATELRAAVGLSDDQSFTEYYRQNQFVPKGFELDAKLLLREEKIKKLEKDVSEGRIGYQTFLFRAYGEDILKAEGHDLKSSLYWYNRRKQGMMDSPIDNLTYLQNILSQAEAMYQREVWYSQRNTLTTRNSLLSNFEDQNKLEDEQLAVLFKEQFDALDDVIESETEIVRLYKAGLLKDFNPTIDEDGDGKVDWYLHRNGILYKVYDPGEAGERGAKAYYNKDGSLNRIEIPAIFGVYGDQFIQGFASSIAGIGDLFIYAGAGIADALQMIGGDFEFDILAETYKNVEGWKASQYLFGNGVYEANGGWTNSDGSVNWDGIGRGTARGLGFLVGMLAATKGASLLANAGVKSITLASGQTVRATVGTGLKYQAARGIGNAINGMIGLGQGVYSSSGTLLTATQATVRGLGFLAVKDFTTTVAALEANKAQLGMETGEIVGKAATMAAMNFGISFFLRSVGDTPALTRLATWQKATFGNAANIKANNLMSNSWSTFILNWSKNYSQRTSFIVVNSVMDMVENFFTMGTQSSLATTGDMFDLKAWGSLFDPQNIALQGSLLFRNVAGGLRGDDMQMGVAGVTVKLGNLQKMYEGEIVSYLKLADKLSAEGKTDAADAILKTIEKARAMQSGRKDKNIVLGTQDALVYLHETFKNDSNVSPVSKAMEKKFKENMREEIILATNAAVEQYSNFVAAKNGMVQSSFITGDIFDPTSKLYEGMTSDKLKKIDTVVKGFVSGLAQIRTFDKTEASEVVSLLTKNDQIAVFKNREEVIKLLQTSEADPVSMRDVFEIQVTKDKKTKKEKTEIVLKNKFLDKLSKLPEADRTKIIENLNKFIAEKLGGDAKALADFYIIMPRNKGSSDSESQQQYAKAIQILKTLSDVVAAESEVEGGVRTIERIGESDVYLIPMVHIGMGAKNAQNLNAMMVNLFTIKFADNAEDKATALKYLLENLTGEKFDDLMKRPDKVNGVLKTLNALASKGYLTTLQLADVLNNGNIRNIIENNRSLISGTSFSKIEEAFQYSAALEKIKTLKDDISNIPKGNKAVSPEMYKRVQAFITFYENLPAEVKAELIKKRLINEDELKIAASINPQTDVARLKKIFSSSLLGSGFDPNKKEDQEIIRFIEEEFINSEGFKEKFQEESGRTYRQNLEGRIAREKNQFRKLVLQGVLSKVTSSQTPVALTEADIRDIIDNVALKNQDANNKFGKSVTAEDVFETVQEINSQTFRSVFFGDQDKTLVDQFIWNIYKKNSKNKPEYTFDEYSKNKKRNGEKYSPRALVHASVFKDPDMTKTFIENARSGERMTFASKLFSEWFIKDTADAKSSFKIVLNVNELIGSRWKQLRQALSNPNVRAESGNQLDDPQELIKMVFGKDYASVASVELMKELTQKENLPMIYRDQLKETGGLLTFEFYMEDGRIVFKSLDQKQVLINILEKFGYDIYDIENQMEDIDGVYMHVENSGKAMSLSFGSIEEKNAFLRSLRTRATELVDEKIKQEIKSNLDYRERLIQRTGGVPYITDDTVFTFDGVKFIPTFLGVESTEDNPFKVTYVTSVFDAFKGGEIKQGKLGGLLIKAYAMSRALPGASIGIDANLQRDHFIYDVIRTIDEFANKTRGQAEQTEESYNKLIVYLTDEEVQAFKDNGDLYDITPITKRKVAGEQFRQYEIAPKLGFQEKALTYLQNNPNNVQLKYILPLVMYDKPSSYEVAMADYLKQNNLEDSTNRAVSNARRLERNSSGADLIIYVNENVRSIYSENFIKEMYGAPFNITYKSFVSDDIKNGEQEVIDAVKGKTFAEIIELNNDPRFKNNIYFTMLYRQLIGAKFYTEEILFGENNTFGFNSDNKNLAELLADSTIKTMLADGLEEIESANLADKDAIKQKIVNRINDFIKNQNKRERQKVYVLEKDPGSLADFSKKETDKVTSYNIESLGVRNNLKGTISVADIDDIIDTFKNDYEFYRASSYKANNELQDPTISKLLAILETSSSSDNKLNIFVEDLFRLSPEEFKKIKNILVADGRIAKDSIQKLEEKFKSIEKNSTYYRQTFEENYRKPYTYEKSFIKLHNTPSASRTNAVAVVKANDPLSKSNFKKQIQEAASRSKAEPQIGKKQIKLSLADFATDNLMRLFKNMLEEDLYSSFSASRLMNNLSHAKFLGEYVYNIAGVSKALKDFMGEKDPSLTTKDYVKIAMSLYNQASGVTYDRSFPAFFLYDKQTGKVIGIDGTGNNKQALDKIGFIYFKDIENETSDRYWMFNVDKNAFNASGSDLREGFRALELNQENKTKVRSIISNYILKEVGELQALENETMKDKIARVLTRNPTIKDKADYIQTVLETNPTIKKLLDQYTPRGKKQLIKNLFLMGENVRVGSPTNSLALQRSLNSIRWSDPSYRTDTRKQNNLIRNINNFAYLINPEAIPYNFNVAKNIVEKLYNEKTKNQIDFNINKKANQSNEDYRKRIGEIFIEINENGTTSVKAQNQIKALALKYGPLLGEEKVVQDIFAHFVYNKNNGATYNFLMLNNDINNIVVKSLSTEDTKIMNGRYDFRSLLNQELYYGDVESLDNMVYEMSLIKTNPVTDLKETLLNPNNAFANSGKKILIPMFYKGRFLNKTLLNELVPGNQPLEIQIKTLMPEFYDKFIKDNKEVTLRNLENYFKNIDNVVKNIPDFEKLGKKAVQDYIIKEAASYGYTNVGKELPLLVSFNGASFDFGSKDIDGILVKSGIFNTRENIFNQNHLDVLQDIIKEKRFISETIFEDQQKNSLSFLAERFGVKVLGAHDSIEDVKTLAKVLFVLADDFKNTNRITSNILVTLDDIHKAATGREIDQETTIRIGEGVEKIKEEDIGDESTLEFVKAYRDAFDPKNTSAIDEAIGKSMSVIKDYLDSIERDVYRKKVNEMINDDLRNKIKVYENIQKNTSRFLPQMLEYFLAKKYPNKPLDTNVSSYVKKGIESESASGYFTGDLFNLFKFAIGSEYEETGTRAISQYKYDEFFSVESEEEAFNILAKAVKTNWGIQDISYEDFQNNKKLYSGNIIRDASENFLETSFVDETTGVIRTGKEYLQAVNDNEVSRREVNSFRNAQETIFEDVFKGLPEDVVLNMLNKSAEVYLRNVNLDQNSFEERVRLRGLFGSNKFLNQLKSVLNKYSFGSNFRRSEFYDRVTATDRNREYKLYNEKGDVVLEKLKANEIAMSEKTYKELTGISYEDSLKVFYPDDTGKKRYRNIPLNIIRYPQDGIGRQAVLNVRILDKSETKYLNKPIMNLDVLKAFLSGDVDGDSISILQPTKGSVAFNTAISKNYNLIFDIFDQGFDSLLTQEKNILSGSLSETQKVVLDFETQRNFASQFIVADLDNLNKNTINYETLRTQRKDYLKNLLREDANKFSDKDLDDILDQIWIKQYDITEFAKSVGESPFTYVSLNIFASDIEINRNAFLLLNAAKIFNFEKQAAADVYSGYKQKLTNKMSEKINSQDGRALFNYAAFDVSEGTFNIISRNIDATKAAMLTSMVAQADSVRRIIGSDMYKYIVNLVANAETGNDIVSAFQLMNKFIMESEDTKDKFAFGLNQYKNLDKDILDSIKSENLEVLKAFGILTGAFDGKKEFDLENMTMLDFNSKMERIFAAIKSNNLGNYWASSNNSAKRNLNFQLEIQKILDSTENNSRSYKEMYDSVHDIYDKDSDGFVSDMHVNAMILINQNVFGENIEVDTHKIVRGNKKTYGAESISLYKLYGEKVNFEDAKILLGLQAQNRKILKSDILLGNGKTIPAGSKIESVIKNKDGTLNVVFTYKRGYDADLKFTVAGTKNFKSTLGGTVNDNLENAIRDSGVEADFVFSQDSFKQKNATPFFNKILKSRIEKGLVEYYRFVDGKFEKVDSIKDADAWMIKQLPTMISQESFFRRDLKERFTDDIAISTGRRNLTGPIITKDYLFEVDGNEIKFSDKIIEDGYKSFETYNQPTLLENNAASLHAYMLNVINIKYSNLSEAEKTKRYKNLTNYSSSELMDLFSKEFKILHKSEPDFFERLSPIEKILVSDELYQMFLQDGNPRILTSVADLEFSSKTASFARKNAQENKKLRNFRTQGGLARDLTTSKYGENIVLSEAFGNMGMVEYLQFLINKTNEAYGTNIYNLSRKNLQDLSIKKILNLGQGVGGSISDNFGTINLNDALLIDNPQVIGKGSTSQKTGEYIKSPVNSVESGVLKPSLYSEQGAPRLTQEDYTNEEYLNYRSFDSETGKFTSKNYGPELNVELGNGNKRLFRSEARFLANIIGATARAKNNYERATLFGYNPSIYLPFSLTNIAVNPNDQRIQLAYTPDFINSDLKNVTQDLRKKLSSDRFLDIVNAKGKTIKDALGKNLISKGFSEANGKALELQEREDMQSVLKRAAIFGDEIRNTQLDTLLRNLNPEEDFGDSYEAQFQKRIEYQENIEALTTQFKADLLASGGIKVGTTLDLEVERMVKDYATNQKFFMKKFSRPLENLADLAERYGAYQELQKYAALKYYNVVIPQIEAALGKEGILEKDKVELTMLLKNYKEEYSAILGKYNTGEEFVSFFERAYAPLVNYFNSVNKQLGEQFRAYSIVTDQASDMLLYLIKPKVKKGFEKGEQVLSKISMFTYNDESLFKAKDLSGPNYFVNMFDKIAILTKQATIYTMSQKIKQLGLTANKGVMEYVEDSLLNILEIEAKKMVLFKKENAEEAMYNYENFVSDIMRFVPEDEFAAYMQIKKQFISKNTFGENLLSIYKKINETLHNKNVPSKTELENTLRTADKKSKEWDVAYKMMKLYEFKEQTLIMLTNMIDSKDSGNKSVLNGIYEGLKVYAEKNGLELTDRFGRLLSEDPTKYKALFPGSTNELKHLVKFSYFGGGFEKNIVLDALGGEVFVTNKSLANFLDKEVFTTRMPNKILDSIAKLNGITSKLIMSNPFRFIDRLVGFTLYDVATLSSSEPTTMLKIGRAMNEVSAMLQSNFAVISPEMQEFLNETGMGLDKTKLTEIFADYNPEKNTSKLLDNAYFNVFEKGFAAQNIVGRYAYWLAVKEKFDTNKPVNYGPSYDVREAIKNLSAKKDPESGEIIVSASGRKAGYMLSNVLGSPGDFPIMAKKLRGLVMFSTFPLAAARFARNMLGSASVAIKDLMLPENRSDAVRWLSGTALGTAGLFALPWLLFEIWGTLLGLEDEEKEKWKEEGGMPELFRTMYTGSPVINRFNTFNQYALLDSMTIKPFRDAMAEGGTFMDGVGRFFLDNIAARAPAPAKLMAETLGGVDTFGGTIRDVSDQWSMWENFQRKLLGYVIGGSGANALTTYLNKDAQYENNNVIEMIGIGFGKVVEAEMGNTAAYKSEIRNYYKANSLIQTERFKESEGREYSQSNFDLEKYNSLRSEIGRALRRKAKPSVIYGIIVNALESGVGIPEVRSALRNNSLEYKLSTIQNLEGFLSQLSDSEEKTIRDAIAYERQTYPFLDDYVMQVNDLYTTTYNYENTPRKIYIPRVYTNNNRYPARLDTNGYLRNTRFNPYFRIQDPYKAYRASWYNIMNFDDEER